MGIIMRKFAQLFFVLLVFMFTTSSVSADVLIGHDGLLDYNPKGKGDKTTKSGVIIRSTVPKEVLKKESDRIQKYKESGRKVVSTNILFEEKEAQEKERERIKANKKEKDPKEELFRVISEKVEEYL